MAALRAFGYGHSLGPFPVVVWFGIAALVFFLTAALLAGLKKQVPLFRKVPVRAHRAIALVGFAFAVIHLLLGLSTYM